MIPIGAPRGTRYTMALVLSAVALLLGCDLALTTVVAFAAPGSPPAAVAEPPLAAAADGAGESAAPPPPVAVREPTVAPPSPFAGEADGVAIALAFAPGFSAGDLRAFVATTGSLVCMVDTRHGRVGRFVAPGADGWPAAEQPLRRWPDFVRAHPSGEWLWIPCTIADPALEPLRAAWPEYTPCVLLAPPLAARVFRERDRQASDAGASGLLTVVELAAAAGSAPTLSVRCLKGE